MTGVQTCALPISLRGLNDQAVSLVLRNREIESALDGFGLCLGVQHSLGALDLGWVQLKVFVSSFGQGSHRITPLPPVYHLCT